MGAGSPPGRAGLAGGFLPLAAVKVHILGNEYLLRSGAGEGQVRRVAAHLNARLGEVMNTANPSNTMSAVVLAALNITNELLQLKDQQDSLLKEIEANAERLLIRLEQEESN